MATAATSPATRLVERVQQLLRVHGYVFIQIGREAEADLAEAKQVQEQLSRVGAEGSDLPRFSARAMSIEQRAADIPLVAQLFIARLVDTFQTFLDDLLRAILLHQRALLKRSESVSMEEVLSHDTMESFLEASIERRLLRWAYKSFRDLRQDVHKEINFWLIQDDKDAARIERLFDIRNLITHNAGIVSKFFLARHPEPKLALGEPFEVTPDEFLRGSKLLLTVSVDTEKRARAKFKFPEEQA